MYERYKNALKEFPKPLAYVDLDLFDQNVKDIAKRVDGSNKTIRVASKSVRVPDLLKRVFSASDIYRGILSFSAKEAVFLAKQGFKDIVLGYPVVDPKLIREVLETDPTITFMVDCFEHILAIHQIASELGVQGNICLDIDMSTKFPGIYFGVYRSPLRTPQQVHELSNSISELESVNLKGVMGYEAQIAGVPDFSPARNFLLNAVVRLLKRRSIPKIAERRKMIVEMLENQGHLLSFVNGGGTGSVETTIKEDVVTEVTVGSGFFSPRLFDYYSQFRHEPAAGFALEVVRIPEQNVYTCFGGGYIASGSIGVDKQPEPYLPKGCTLFPNEGAGEVQTPVHYKGTLSLDDPVFFRHAKAGELCEHFNEVYLIKGSAVTGTAKTYRGHGLY